MDRCAACSADDEMLFACRHCERPFCRAHLLDHGCDASPEDERGEANEEQTGGETEGAQAAVAGAGGAGGTRTQSVTEGALEAGVVEPELRSEATATTATTDTIDGQAPAEHAPLMRTMDTRRSPGTLPRHEPQTVTEWLRQQTYFTLLVKVGGLALLLNLVVFGGLAVVRYGLLGVL